MGSTFMFFLGIAVITAALVSFWNEFGGGAGKSGHGEHGHGGHDH